ncbi:5-hydroxytryptamine receptor 3A-like isoform X2 [Cynoglossus semilaevis]|nr:5-hydroxytryptamine receptor 3A-like isoform X2 [Cynoglossus semilaevis]
MLINRNYTSQPQYENCTHIIKVPLVEYQTLSVDTRNLLLNSRLQATLMWTDPGLTWNTSVYHYDQVVLPVEKVWTPEIHVTNGIRTRMHQYSNDLLLFSNGTLVHTVIIMAEVNCEVNLFNYPFAEDACPVAIQTWAVAGCGTSLRLGNLKMIDSSHGDWETLGVSFEKQSEDQNYIWVLLRIKHFNPFITLMFPTILIVLADVVSFSLPLGGGERNTFKVTLVLSHTMLLTILNEKLPGDSQCSPIIRLHFCICLVLLFLSMLVSLVLTRVAKEGSIIFCCCPKKNATKSTGNKKEDTEAKGDISVIKLNGPEEENQMLQRVVKILQSFENKELENEKYQNRANAIDKAFFWLYFVCSTLYFCSMLTVMRTYECTVNHFNFWD